MSEIYYFFFVLLTTRITANRERCSGGILLGNSITLLVLFCFLSIYKCFSVLINNNLQLSIRGYVDVMHYDIFGEFNLTFLEHYDLK